MNGAVKLLLQMWKKKKKKNGDDLLFLSLAVCVESYRGKEINGISWLNKGSFG